jgi:serine/threonine-protein kinase
LAKVGDRLGRYELLEGLGKGAAGTVFKARDTLLGIEVCVKTLHPGLATQPGVIERFKRELLLARRIAHPGVCKIFDLQEDGDTHFLVMEYVQGETLSTILNRGGSMEVREAADIIRKCAEALAAAHKVGVVHRDIKPGNIIIGKDGKVTIVDFGVATSEDLDRLTRAGVVLGSRSYMAPETWQGAPASPASDVWALGIIFYGCVTGRLPYKGEGVVGVFDAIKTTTPTPASVLNPDVTPEVEEILHKTMAVEVSDRYTDAAAVEAALATLLATLGGGEATAAPSAPAPSLDAATVPGAPAYAPPPGAAPSGASERLHRPGATPAVPSKADDAFDAKATDAQQAGIVTEPPSPAMSGETRVDAANPIEGIGEMSLYAGDQELNAGPTPDDDNDGPTRVNEPPPVAPGGPVAATAVADAFDAAFGTGAAATELVGDQSKAEAAFDAAFGTADDLAPPTDMGPPSSLDAPMTTPGADEPAELGQIESLDVMLGQTVVNAGAPETAPEPGEGLVLGQAPEPMAQTASGSWEVHSSSEAITDIASIKPAASAELEEAAALPLLTGDEVSGDQPAPITGISDGLAAQPMPEQTVVGSPILLDAADEVEASDPELAAFEATHIGGAPSMSEEEDEISGETEVLSTRKALPSQDAPPSRRNLYIAAGVGTGLVVLLLVVFVGGGPDEDVPPPEDPAATDPSGTDPGGTDPSPATDPDPTALPAVADGDAGAAEAAGDEWDFGGGDDEEPATDEPATDEPATDEPATDEPATDEPVEDEPVEDEPVEDEPVVEPAVEEPDPPSADRPKPRADPAKSRYRAKKKALNRTLSSKGILPGDVSAVDRHRRAMLKAARAKRWSAAASSAERAATAAKSVKIDASFVGKKLARFNTRYDKIKDPGLRKRLKGVLKKVGSDFSAKRYAAANKKLNRAFTLMARSR